MVIPRVYLDTSCWMKNIGDLIQLHEKGQIELVTSSRVESELASLKEDDEKAPRASRAQRGIERLSLENLYWPRAGYGMGRYGEIRYGDAGRLYGKDFPSKDKEVAEYAIAAHSDFAKRGRLAYIVTDDLPILRRKELIQREAPQLEVLSLKDFRPALERAGFQV